MPVLSFDLARLRGLYPTLGSGTAHLDGSFSPLLPESVIRAIIATLRSSPTQPGSGSPRSRRAAASVLDARRAVGDLVGAMPESVVLGPNTAALTLRFAWLLSRDWQLGDEVVLSRLDADDVIAPWLRAAREAGGVVHWAEVDLDTGELPTWQYERLVSRRTRVVTVPLGNPATGAVPDVRAIADIAHRYQALVVVDAGAAVPHMAIDLDELGADVLVVSAPSFGGPTAAAAVTRAGLLHELDVESDRPVPERFEVGGLPVEVLDGLTAAVDHLADLAQPQSGSRRNRLVTSLTEAGQHERTLFTRLEDGLRGLPHVTVLGAGRTGGLPVVAFTVAGSTPAHVGEQLQRRGVSVWTGRSGVTQALQAFGADELGGAVFAGLMPYTAAKEVEQLLSALTDLRA
jgi:cysteine desulfurase family protein (TIGR01976 family)